MPSDATPATEPRAARAPATARSPAPDVAARPTALPQLAAGRYGVDGQSVSGAAPAALGRRAARALWRREWLCWHARAGRPRLEDRRLSGTGRDTAVLSYRIRHEARLLQCRSVYMMSCGAWMLVEHAELLV